MNQVPEAIESAPDSGTFYVPLAVGTDQPPSDEDAITRLTALSAIEYDRIREAEAKALKVRVGTLDKLVHECRQSQAGQSMDDSLVNEVEPWPASIDPAVLFNEIATVVHQFIVCPPETANAAVLWCAMTWLMDVVQVAPLAVITAPEMRCGKSQFLFVLGRLVCRPIVASNISPAALFRIMALSPTILVDEVDAFMRENEELRGLLNAGHTRDSAYVIRVVGDDHTPTKFNVWGAKALAGIGHLAGTLMDRSVTLELRRKLPTEKVMRLRHAEPGLFDTLAAKLARFAEDYRDKVAAARPVLPDELHDRAQDNWEPLLAIADVAGGEWPKLARLAALKLSGSSAPAQSVGAELLADIQGIFNRLQINRINTADLLKELIGDEEAPWATYNRGRPLSPRQLSSRLSDYGIRSKNVRTGYSVTKGFEKAQFDEAFACYLAPPPILSATPLQPSNDAGLSVADAQSVAATKATSVADMQNVAATKTQSATPEAAPIVDCSGVADKTEGTGQEGVFEEDEELF